MGQHTGLHETKPVLCTTRHSYDCTEALRRYRRIQEGPIYGRSLNSGEFNIMRWHEYTQGIVAEDPQQGITHSMMGFSLPQHLPGTRTVSTKQPATSKSEAQRNLSPYSWTPKQKSLPQRVVGTVIGDTSPHHNSNV